MFFLFLLSGLAFAQSQGLPVVCAPVLVKYQIVALPKTVNELLSVRHCALAEALPNHDGFRFVEWPVLKVVRIETYLALLPPEELATIKTFWETLGLFFPILIDSLRDSKIDLSDVNSSLPRSDEESLTQSWLIAQAIFWLGDFSLHSLAPVSDFRRSERVRDGILKFFSSGIIFLYWKNIFEVSKAKKRLEEGPEWHIPGLGTVKILTDNFSKNRQPLLIPKGEENLENRKNTQNPFTFLTVGPEMISHTFVPDNEAFSHKMVKERYRFQLFGLGTELVVQLLHRFLFSSPYRRMDLLTDFTQAPSLCPLGVLKFHKKSLNALKTSPEVPPSISYLFYFSLPSKKSSH
jgi:hypothetical protein